MIIKKQNYLNNKDILKEIHKSKNSYCWFDDPESANYDIIVSSLDAISDTLVPTTEILTDDDGDETVVIHHPAAKVARAKRLTVAAQDAALLTGVKLKADEVGISWDQMANEDIIFRVTAWGHIPEAPPAPPKVKKGKRATASIIVDDDDVATEYDDEEVVVPTKYIKVNFPPFEHYRLGSDGVPVCIGRSHWEGDMETGHFSKEHGEATRKLALMYIKLCERYATRSNWRGYSYNDEMRSQALLQLSQIGLQFDESKGANPFAYYTTVINNSFTRVLHIEKRNQHIRDDILEQHELNPSYTRQNQDRERASDE